MSPNYSDWTIDSAPTDIRFANAVCDFQFYGGYPAQIDDGSVRLAVETAFGSTRIYTQSSVDIDGSDAAQYFFSILDASGSVDLSESSALVADGVLDVESLGIPASSDPGSATDLSDFAGNNYTMYGYPSW